jgi:hypothetical protein
VEAVQLIMAGIQLRLQQRGQLHCDVFNMDESPSMPGLPLTKVYGLPGEKGTQANTDDHQRFTTIICLCGDGRVLPAAFIISNSIESDDQSGQRVLSNLLKDANFNGDGQWTLRTWKKKLMVAPKQAKKSAAAVEIEFTRPYLIHPDGRIVWSQRKAYMDTPGAVLYLDVLLNPYRIKSGRRNATLIWDNCKTHNRPCVLEAFEKSSFFVDFLPKNMTDSMQPVDIIACGPLKAGQRALRVEDLYTYQQEFASDMDAALKKKAEELPVYEPPPPSIVSCILAQSRIFATNFSTPAFQDSVVRVFQSVGLTPLDNGLFNQYTTHDAPTRLRHKKLFRHLGPAYYARDGASTEFSGVTLFKDWFEDPNAEGEGSDNEEQHGFGEGVDEGEGGEDGGNQEDKL